MSELRRRLVSSYAAHYQRLNSESQSAGPDRRAMGYMEATYGTLIRELPARSMVLDLGCGTGALLEWLRTKPQLIPVGVDASDSQIALVRKRLPDVAVELSDGLEFLEKQPNRFAGIFCTDVLEHIPGDDALLQWVEAAAAALTPGGFFVARSPNAANLAACYSRYLDLTHERCFTSGTMLQLFEAAGLSDVRIVPIRTDHLTGRLRLRLEHTFHKALFRFLGRGPESVFTSNVCAVGFKTDAS